MRTLADVFVALRVTSKQVGPDIKKQLDSAAGDAGSSAGRKFSSGMGKESKSGMSKAGKDAGDAYGKHFGGNLKSIIGKSVLSATAILSSGALIGAGVGLFKGMISEAREAEKITRLTEAVIKSTGGAAGVSAKEISKLADSIGRASGVDDDLIQGGENLLLTFTNIKNVGSDKIFDQATQSAVDMTAALNGGEVTQEGLKSSTIQLGKALNDPIKGITALSRVGVSFTQGQRDQIKAMVASGDTMGAQKIILEELNKEFGGAAAAAADPAQKAKVAWQQFQETLGGLVLPVVTRLAEFFTNTVLPGIEAFISSINNGTTGAGGFVGVMESLGVFAGQTFSWIRDNAVPVIVSMGQVLFDAGQKVLAMVTWLREHEGIAKALVIAIGGLVAITYAHIAVMNIQAAGGLITFLKNYLLHTHLVRGATAAWAAVQWALNAAHAAAGFVRMIPFLISYFLQVTLVSAATKAWAVVQAVLNAVMSANPIAIVVIAIAALVAAVILAWQHSATFRDIVIGAWNGIKAAVGAVVNWFVTVAWPFLQQVWAGIAAGVMLLYNNAFKPAFNGMILVVQAAWGWIQNTGWPALRAVFSAVAAVVSVLWNNVVRPAFAGWAAVIGAAWGWISNTGWPALKVVLNAVGSAISLLFNNVVKPGFSGWVATIGAAWGWISNTGWPILKAVFNAIGTTISVWWNNVVKPIWTAFKNTVEVTFGWIANTGWPILKRAFDAIGTAISIWWNNLVKPIWTAFKNTVEVTFNWIGSTGWPFLKRVFDAMGAAIGIWWNNIVKPIWSALKNTVEVTFNWIARTGWPILKGAFDNFVDGLRILGGQFREKFDFVKDKVQSVVGFFLNTVVPNVRDAFNSIKSFVTDLWNGFRDKFDQISDKVSEVMGRVKDSFQKTKDSIKTIWEGVKEAVRTPINYVVNPVYAKIREFWNHIVSKVPGIGNLPPVAQVARGGVMPGYTPGRDVMYAHVSGGEAIMRPEWTRAVGKGWVDRANAAARQGGVRGAARFMGGYAEGGVIDNIAGFFGKAKDFVLGNLLNVAKPVIDGIRGLFNRIPGQGEVGRAARAIPNKLLDKAIEFLKGKDIAPTYGGLWAGGGVPGIMAWLKQQDRKPYIWASAGPAGYDCSGIVSAVWNLVMGRNPYNHTFSTHTQAGYFTDPPGGLFEAGWSNAGERGGGSVGHTAAVFNGLPFEAGGNNGNVSVGRSGITPVTAFAHRGSMPRAAELIKAHLVQAFETPRGGVVSGAVMGWIREALAREGVSNWQAWMETLVKRESNGNRFARSFSSNGPLGYAIGLAQLLASTFAFYRDRSLPNDRTDPIANLVASIRYIKSRYGSIFNVGHANPNGSPDPGGYAFGGVVNPANVKLMDKGGWLQPGEFSFNGTSKAELHTPADTPIRLHPKDIHKLGEVIGLHLARAVGSYGTATARSADLISRS